MLRRLFGDGGFAGTTQSREPQQARALMLQARMKRASSNSID